MNAEHFSGQGGKPAELRSLGELLETCDPVPKGLANAAYSAMRRRWNAESQALSLVGDSTSPGVRDAETTRVLTFTMPSHVLEIDLERSTPGWYAAAGVVMFRDGPDVPAGEVVLRHSAGDSVARLDQCGAFRAEHVPRGPLSVVFRAPRVAPAVADWLVC